MGAFILRAARNAYYCAPAYAIFPADLRNFCRLRLSHFYLLVRKTLRR